MPRCERCGNEYDKTFTVKLAGEEHVFDSFECAIATLAPECENCGIKIMGHGMEAAGRYFCCHSCAEAVGVRGLEDRI